MTSTAPFKRLSSSLMPNETAICWPTIKLLLSPEACSVLAPPPVFGCEPAFALGRLERRPGHPRFDVLRRVEARVMLADDLLGGIALDVLGAGVPVGDVALRVEHED